MDWAAYGLSRDPFQRSAELDDACLPNTMAALLSELLSSLRSPQGVSVLVADSGSGKSVAAAAFARRVGGVAHVAHLTNPISSISAIAREALAQFDPTDFDFNVEEDWVAALRARVERCARMGRATAILIDDAHRLSPQALDGLADLFSDDETLRLHVFLFGRPRLLDRMHAGADKALEAHLLQICRLEPLGVRESVRYLERRLAICGGELAALYNDEAIDEIVQTAEGRILRLEEVAVEALRRASRRGQSRASVEDVVAMARHAVAEEEEDAMNVRQQPLRFELTDEEAGGEAVEWNDDETEDRSVEWGDEDTDDGEQWQADESEETDEEALTWDTSPHHLDDDGLHENDEEDDDENDDADEPSASGRAAHGATRRRLVGPAVLSISAGLALVWAANHVPGPSADARHGRDAMLFAEPLTSKPSEIMRLATTVEAADADAQVTVWRAQPPRPVAKAPQVADRAGTTTLADGVAAPAKTASAAASPKETGPAVVASLPVGPPENAAAPDPGASAKVDAPAQPAVAKVAQNTAPTPKAASTKPKSVASAKRSSGPVFTVQLGAFKARRNAEELVSKLRGKSPHILQEGGLYRVISGSFATKRDAVVHEASLKRAGYTTYVRTAVF